MSHREADIMINGVTLTHAQSMAVRVAVTSFLMDLPERLADLGPIGPLYQARHGQPLSTGSKGDNPAVYAKWRSLTSEARGS